MIVRGFETFMHTPIILVGEMPRALVILFTELTRPEVLKARPCSTVSYLMFTGDKVRRIGVLRS